MRKTILFIALSLDGYIADANGGVDWLGGQEAGYTGDYGYSEFLKEIDTVIMGYTTYHQLTTELAPDNWPYPNYDTFVLTHQPHPEQARIFFKGQAVTDLIQELRQQPGEAIWISGGANVVNQLVEADLIDEFHLSIIPTIIGQGVRLFNQPTTIPLKLISTSSDNGVIDCVYRRRN
ncbi:dihydrofolate reductase family protein [Paucilactobacillus nenjiangensis]|uniref:dihydrofolate reductase family protein n=1 Tax=Paucilactobacillus nenjiangensis TaxID=1296540 RepID=UPI0010F99FDE|nr:dihydrofolate reductase family protein [Paucilactobacillus nenjiangensis]